MENVLVKVRSLEIPTFMSGFVETFNKSSINDLRDFLKKYGHVQKWYIVSDYSFSGANTNWNAAAFVIVPYVEDIAAFQDRFDTAEPQDIKSRQGLTNRFAKFLEHCETILPIVVDFDKALGFIGGTPDFATEERIFASYQRCILAESELAKGDYEASAFWSSAHVQGEKLMGRILGRNVTIGKAKILEQFVAVVNIVAYLVALIRKETRAHLIGWMPDRDPIMQIAGGDSDDFFSAIYMMLCQARMYEIGVPYDGVKLPLSVQDPATGAMWFDSIVRIPDYFVGCLSRMPISGQISDAALNKLLKKFACGNQNGLIALKVGIKDVIRWGFKKLSKKERKKSSKR